MKHLVKINFLILLISVALSCKNDDDDPIPEPIDKPDYTHIFTSSGEMITSIDSIYSILRLGEQVERVELYPIVVSGDAMAGGEPGGSDQHALQAMMRFQAIPNNSYINAYWSSMYRGIALSNKFIINADVSKDSSDIDESLCNRAIGEAYFLKALFYYKLTLLFGGFPQIQQGGGSSLCGIPIVEGIFNPDSIVYSRPSLDTTWYKITEYLNKSIELLPERSEYSSTDVGRASKGAAKSMLAKVSVFTENWVQAFQYAQEVINSGEYFLEGDNNHPGPYEVNRLAKEGMVSVKMSGYKWIWQPEANNCGESVFYVQHYADHTARFPEGQMGNLLPQYYGIRNVWTYNNTDNLVPTTIAWGFILPTSYFVKTAYKDVGCEPVEGQILDPRYKLTVISETDSVPYFYADNNLRNKYPDSVLFNAWNNWPCTGYTTWKYFTDPIFVNERVTLGDNPQSTKFLRYSDVLLLGAEAALHIGQNTFALEWINLVRERARNSGNTGYPMSLTSVTLDDIYAERRVELAFEGHQFYDIVRTGRAQEVLKNDAMNYQTITNPETNQTIPQQFGDNFDVGKSEVLPIPIVAINVANGIIIQNQGY